MNDPATIPVDGISEAWVGLVRTLMSRFGILVWALSALAPAEVAAQGILRPTPSLEQQPESIDDLLENAKQGNAQAQYDLAVYFARRKSGKLASTEAVHWLQRAAERGHIEAQSDLGLLYYRGFGVPQDSAEAAKWLRRAAEQGHAAAQADLGQLCYLGDGVPRNLAQAAEWYGKAAEQGVAKAQFNLAGLHANGAGVSKDAEKATWWYREAAERGLAEAQHALAVALIRGEGVEKDFVEAVRWLRRAADRGLAKSQLLLARRYETGLGVRQDFGRAVRWYLLAADQGLVEAQRSLGSFYWEGRSGTADPVRGQMWLIVAARGAPEDRRELIERERDEAARKLTAEQSVEAERLARQWKRKTWAELQARSPRELILGTRSNDLPGFFHAAGRNIAAAQLEYEEYWKPHIEQSRRGILEAARLVRKPGTALVLGASQCREIPLEELARTFDRVVLVDLDAESMSEAVASLPEALQRRVDIRVSDVTSFAQPLMEATARIVEQARTAAAAFTALGSLYDRIETLRRFPELPQADLVVSSLVLSELVRYPSTYTAQLVKEKFGADLAEWRGYGALWRKLRAHAAEDHGEMLVRLGRPESVVYFADTVGRGPDLNRVDGKQRRSALHAIAGQFAQIGLFQKLRTRPESWEFFHAAFRRLGPGETAAEAEHDDASDAPLKSLVAEIEAAPGVTPEGADRAADAASNLLCRDHFPVEMEISAFEAILDAYEAVEPSALEQLLDWDAFLTILEGRGVEPVSASKSWKWLEYACYIPRRAGGFSIRSFVLRNPIEK